MDRLLGHTIRCFSMTDNSLTSCPFFPLDFRRHCRDVPPTRRRRCSVYFPRTIDGLYQAAQTMSRSHFRSNECVNMSRSLCSKFEMLLAARGTSSGGAGRQYWRSQASRIGLVDSEDDSGIRFRPYTVEPASTSSSQRTSEGKDGDQKQQETSDVQSTENKEEV